MRTGVSCRTLRNMDHYDWLKQTTGDAATRAVGRKAQISDRTLGNQIESRQIPAGNVIKIALAYNKNPVTALIDCGYIPSRYAAEKDPLAALRRASEDDLAAEVLYRMKLAGDHTVFTTPVDELLTESPDDPESWLSDVLDGDDPGDIEQRDQGT